MKTCIGNWNIDLHVDDDGHLTLGINHDDGSKVHRIEEDLATNEQEWADRFTTERIEQDYRDDIHEDNLTDVEADAMTLASAGMGTDSDYGGGIDRL